jgi:hypothetical protein
MAGKGRQDEPTDSAPAPAPARPRHRPREVDPGDAVPEGVAPAEPVPLTEEDRRVKAKLERLPRRD